MNIKWLTITIYWGATTFAKSGVKKQDENAQHCTRPCHPEHPACVLYVCARNPRSLTLYLEAEQTHCLIKRPQARGNVNMPTRMTSDREQEASMKIFAELLLWNMLPPSKLRTFWIRPIGTLGQIWSSLVSKGCVSWMVLFSWLVGLLLLISPRTWFSPLTHVHLSGNTQI